MFRLLPVAFREIRQVAGEVWLAIFNSNKIVAAEKVFSFWEKKFKRGSDFATDCI